MKRRQILKLAAASSAIAGLSNLPFKVKAQEAGKFQVWFIRHAESEVNVLTSRGPSRDDGVTYPLTHKGVQQAIDLADSLVDVDVSAIFTSTRLRCVQTADAIGFKKRIVLQLAPQIVEVDFGIYPGDSEALQLYTSTIQNWLINKQYDTRYGEGESYNDLKARFIPSVTNIIQQYKHDPRVLIFVAHGGILGLMLPLILSNVPDDYLLSNSIPNTGIIKSEFRNEQLFCTEWAGTKLI